jgi:predicted ATP-binding protein involved in virulence
MIIHDLTLENFHGFDKRHITFSDQFTVLIGDNGTGKTGILDGVAIALGSLLSGFNGVNSRHIRKDEVHRKIFNQGGLINVQEQYPVRITCTGKLDNQQFTWSRAKNSSKGSTTSKEAREIMDYASYLQKEVREGKPVILPVISYYGTARLWLQKNENRNYQLRKDRLGGYSFCLDPASSEKLFTRWMEKMTYIELQRQETPPVLKAVRRAVSQCMNEWRHIEFNVDAEELQVIKVDGTRLPFRLLSDGIRNMIGIVADIAHRMAQLNPALEDEVSSKTPGVVLIDEIDLHLHPRWQRRVVGDLKRTFPNVQFIVTTHSPFIIQSLEEGELRRLHNTDDNEEVMSEEFVNKSIEDITEKVMEVDNVQRSEKLTEMYRVAQEYYTLLQQGKKSDSEEKIKKLKQQLDQLESLYSDEVAYYAFLQMKREDAGLGRN